MLREPVVMDIIYPIQLVESRVNLAETKGYSQQKTNQI